ncbi:M1 family aminopeptidase [Prevotella sp. KH2C16]|uniref:M1 family metallopeptidase n=1 Tax=Prevotella sp. KH2C16 TaxID=1855325 RepID=UPI0008F36D33|nr:M1 family aminopeptidase [Prevotella sp. KH2C16]SFG65566.1 aminopeptidase N [Prevotella sp. KH2C16]
MSAKTFSLCNLLLTIFLQVAAPCATQADTVEDGVSHALAIERSTSLDNIEYQLHFNIPADKAEKVTGTASLRFYFSGKGDLVLDFAGDSFDGSCIVNGKQVAAEWVHEHIIIPNRHLLQGKNELSLSFVSADAALNRHDDYLYTLFVPAHARTVFPCFDQPDLKAKFSLDLQLPADWKQISSADSHPIPTYLFSFTAGKFQESTVQRDGRTLQALYRETDARKTAQLDKIFDEAALSIRWMEEYTGISYPFDKYGFVVLPGYQFGGMEHPGAIQFTDREIFLGDTPTPDEELTRLQLIAHETAHMWFGDLVTMRWFSDVWTKEVFANFFAAKISREQFPEINHELNFLKAYQVRALSTDRTDGTHPIHQMLANLKDAGLLYGNIIYQKAPVMMRKFEEQIGEEKLRRGLIQYLKRFSYGNATWDDLIEILQSEAPESGIKEWVNVWVKQKGLPTIHTQYADGRLIIAQQDPWGRGLVWKQKFKIGLYDAHGDSIKSIEVDMQQPQVQIPLAEKPYAIIPNYDGSGYGRFVADSLSCAVMEYSWRIMPNELNRFAAIMTLYENYLMNRIKPGEYMNTMNTFLMNEENPLVASALCSYLLSAYGELSTESKKFFEYYLLNDAQNHPEKSIKQKLLRYISQTCISAQAIEFTYEKWKLHSDLLFTEQDFTDMAYHLAIVKPDKWQEILQIQRARLSNIDELRAFDYISRACNPDKGIQQKLFESLLDKDNRSVEPWAAKMLALLSTGAREPQNNDFVYRGLNALQEIQQTGDIFFPTNWLNALLGGHNSHEAKFLVGYWIEQHPDYPEPLMNKVKQSAYHLLRSQK